MKKKYRIDTLKASVSTATVLFCFTIFVSLIIIHRFGSAAVFFLIGLIFIRPMLIYGTTISVEASGIRSFFLWKTLKFLSWEEITEVGVAGTRIFHKKDTKKTGTLYIYISKVALTDEDRFNMMLNFPPKDIIFLTYSKQRLDAIQMLFSNKIQTYNAGDLHI
ncbi:MAG: hypothetical protein K0S04_615 [Herbinix sp.]|jgi:hypothetical protein|nr:hypothetical protein [Herbinix sp.]